MNDEHNISEELSAYLDGELSEAEARRIEQALRDDPALARELEALRAARELVRSLPTAKAPEGFAATVMDKAERLQLVAPIPPARRWRFHWASLATAAVILIAVGIGVVVTAKLTLTPSWPDNLARKGGPQRRAIAPAAEDEAKDAKTSRTELAEANRDLRARQLTDAAGKPLDVIEGGAEVSPGLAASAEQPADQRGLTNVPVYALGREKSGKVPAGEAEPYGVPSTSAATRSVQDIGMMPPIAAAPGPRGDRPAGVVTQVGEPLYSGWEVRERAPATGPAMAMGARATVAGGDRLQPVAVREELAAQGEQDRASLPAVAGARLGERAGTVLELAAPPPAAKRGSLVAPTSQPASAPASAPASQPTSQPASQPSSQPTSQPDPTTE